MFFSISNQVDYKKTNKPKHPPPKKTKALHDGVHVFALRACFNYEANI